MILVKMMGGLGNQLFQYSFARYLEELLREPVWLDTLFFATHRQRKPGLSKIGVRYRKSLGERYLWYRLQSRRFLRWEERDFDVSRCLGRRGKSMFFWGYWQKAEYAAAGRTGILEGFERFPKRAMVRRLADEIRASDSLSIHIRRGDYKGIPKFALLSKEYYRQALETVNAQSAQKWYLFSDERGVEKDLLPDETNIVRMADYGLEDFEEFYLMSLCRRNVAANSTYSWWAAFLNERQGRKIVLPEHWMNSVETFNIEKFRFEGARFV